MLFKLVMGNIKHFCRQIAVIQFVRGFTTTVPCLDVHVMFNGIRACRRVHTQTLSLYVSHTESHTHIHIHFTHLASQLAKVNCVRH